ncbi:MAG: hypothetical protein ABUK01_03620 [Leptospirales bacterium]
MESISETPHGKNRPKSLSLVAWVIIYICTLSMVTSLGFLSMLAYNYTELFFMGTPEWNLWLNFATSLVVNALGFITAYAILTGRSFGKTVFNIMIGVFWIDYAVMVYLEENTEFSTGVIIITVIYALLFLTGFYFLHKPEANKYFKTLEKVNFKKFSEISTGAKIAAITGGLTIAILIFSTVFIHVLKPVLTDKGSQHYSDNLSYVKLAWMPHIPMAYPEDFSQHHYTLDLEISVGFEKTDHALRQELQERAIEIKQIVIAATLSRNAEDFETDQQQVKYFDEIKRNINLILVHGEIIEIIIHEFVIE